MDLAHLKLAAFTVILFSRYVTITLSHDLDCLESPWFYSM